MLLLLSLACDGPKSVDPGTTGSTSHESTPTEPVTWSTDPCERMQAGPPGTGTVAELSEAHARIRLFGPPDSTLPADTALITLLQDETALTAPDLDTYAASVGDTCALDAAAGSLGAAAVTLVGDVAVIHPGTGSIALPEGAAAVAVDLRALPDVPELRPSLAAAVGAARVTPLAWAARQTRIWNGWVDQVYSQDNVYSVDRTDVPGDEIAPTGTADLPIVLLTGDRLAPAAAELAASLDTLGAAWIVGADVPVAVAESRWSPVGDRGLAARMSALRSAAGDTLPDVIPADVSTRDPEVVLADWATWAAPTPATGTAARANIARRNPYTEEVSTENDLGTARAALLVAHGVFRLFYPYFAEMGDEIDPRLDEVLDGLDPADRCDLTRRVGRLGNALADGHMFFGDDEGSCYTDVAGYLPVFLDHIGADPVIGQNVDPGLHLGDRLVARDGVPIADLQADWLTWHGGATTGYARDLADRELYYLDGPTTYTVADPDGVEREVVVQPADADTYVAVPWVASVRPNGWLDDLGAPDIAYLNLDASVTTTTSQVTDLVAEAQGARGLVVDMRGYPGVNHYAVAQALIPVDFSSPIFEVPTWTGPDQLDIVRSVYDESPSAAPYTGPIVLLVNPTTVSAAENFSIMLVAADREVTVVGRPSAGTNGNITGVHLPGGYAVTFTGMGIRFPDETRFVGVGIVPDVEVSPTAADYRDGRDPVIAEAIAVLGG